MTTDEQLEFLLGLKSEVLEIKETISNDYLKIQDSLKLFVGKSDLVNNYLSGYITEEEVLNKFQTKDDSISLDNYVEKDDIVNFIDKFELDSKLSLYMTRLDVESVLYDALDSYVDNNKLNNYVKNDDLDNIKLNISNNSLKISNIETSLSSTLSIDDVDNILKDFVTKTEISDFVTKTDMISYIDEQEFVYQNDIINFVTYKDVSKTYINKNDISLYIPDVSNLIDYNELKIINDKIDELYSDILSNTNKINEINENISLDYYNKEEVDNKINNIDIDSKLLKYIRKDEMGNYINDIDTSSFATKNDLYYIYTRFNKFVTIDDISEFVSKNDYDDDKQSIYNYINKNIKNDNFTINENYLKSQLYNYVTKDDLKYELDEYTNNCIKRFDNYVNKVVYQNDKQDIYNYINDKVKINLNDSYLYKKDKFFDNIIENNDGSKVLKKSLNNGLYIVGTDVFLIYEDTLIQLNN